MVAAVAVLAASCGGGSNGTGDESSGPAEEASAFSKAPDPSLLVETEAWGTVPADQVVVVLAAGSDRGDAEDVAGDLGGTIVGEVRDIALYEIETGGTTAGDLDASLRSARANEAVDLAFANVQLTLAATADTRCAPLADPAYAGAIAPYELIGVQAAWDVLRAAGVDFADVHVGVVDSEITTALGELSGRVRVTGMEAGDLSDQPLKVGNITHGTAVAHLIAADADNGGVAGVAAVLGGSLSLTTSDIISKAGPTLAGEGADLNDPAVLTVDGVGYVLDAIVALQRQVDGGATIINASFGPSRPGKDLKPVSDAYRRFLEDLATRHPEVLVVVSAGNEGAALDGTNSFLQGHRLPNVVTVGAVDATGAAAPFTNVAGAGGEVSLSAPGVDVPVGTGSTGKMIIASGTSFSAPLVSAAAALLRAADPSLTAAEIKQRLVSTARQGVLRVDEAVLRVVNDLRSRAGLAALDLAAVERLVAVDLSAARTSTLAYTVTATLGSVDPAGTDVAITAKGDGAVDGPAQRGLRAAGAVTFGYRFTEAPGTATVTVTRLDNRACSTLELRAVSYDGRYEGTFAYADGGTYRLVFDVLNGTIGGSATSTAETHPGDGITCRSTVTLVPSGAIDDDGLFSGELHSSATLACNVPTGAGPYESTASFTGQFTDGKLVGFIIAPDGATYDFTITHT